MWRVRVPTSIAQIKTAPCAEDNPASSLSGISTKEAGPGVHDDLWKFRIGLFNEISHYHAQFKKEGGG
jgi:hypothetical protein